MRPLGALLAIVVLSCARSAWAAGPTKDECVSANEAAQDLRSAGKLREAREKLVLCISQSCPGPVRDDCAQRLDEVDKAMPTIVFEVKDSAGNDVQAATATMDGQNLADKLGGASIAVDPGEHHFVFADPDGIAPSAETTIIVREGDKDRHVRVVLGGASSKAAEPTKEQPASPGNADKTWRTIALVAGGVGLVGVLVGVGAGIAGDSKHSTLQGECTAGVCPTSAQGDLDSFHSLRTWSTVGYVVGALGIAGGVALWFLAPSSADGGSVGVRVGPASAAVVGAF